MAKKINLKALLFNPPKLHEDHSGTLISGWRIDDETIVELSNRLRAGMRTVETGAGLSTIIFAANGCHHTCIVPEQELVDRIRAYCDSAKVDHGNVEFLIAKSRDVVHQLTPGAYDLALIDGNHGLPTVYVDFSYLTLALRKQGVLIVDDMHIYSCRSVAEFMEADTSWRVEVRTARFALGVKLDETGGVDSDWSQPYVFNRSAAGNNAQGVFLDPAEWYPTGYEPELVPAPDLMRKEGVQTLEEWFRWGEEWAMALKVYGGIKKSSRVLEVACGLGRIAFPLRFQLLNGTYDGFDASWFKIEFLRRRFQSLYSNFRFDHADLHNHDRKGTEPVGRADFRFPYHDNAFDTVFAASTFTHLVPEAASKYFHEMRRVLVPQGRALIGGFLLDHFQRGRSRPLGFSKQCFDFDYFPHPAYPESFAVPDPNSPEPLTAYKQDLLLGFAAEAGLEVAEPTRAGMWSGASDHFLLAEDLLVFRRTN